MPVGGSGSSHDKLIRELKSVQGGAPKIEQEDERVTGKTFSREVSVAPEEALENITGQPARGQRPSGKPLKQRIAQKFRKFANAIKHLFGIKTNNRTPEASKTAPNPLKKTLAFEAAAAGKGKLNANTLQPNPKPPIAPKPTGLKKPANNTSLNTHTTTTKRGPKPEVPPKPVWLQKTASKEPSKTLHPTESNVDDPTYAVPLEVLAPSHGLHGTKPNADEPIYAEPFSTTSAITDEKQIEADVDALKQIYTKLDSKRWTSRNARKVRKAVIKALVGLEDLKYKKASLSEQRDHLRQQYGQITSDYSSSLQKAGITVTVPSPSTHERAAQTINTVRQTPPPLPSTPPPPRRTTATTEKVTDNKQDDQNQTKTEQSALNLNNSSQSVVSDKVPHIQTDNGDLYAVIDKPKDTSLKERKAVRFAPEDELTTVFTYPKSSEQETESPYAVPSKPRPVLPPRQEQARDNIYDVPRSIPTSTPTPSKNIGDALPSNPTPPQQESENHYDIPRSGRASTLTSSESIEDTTLSTQAPAQKAENIYDIPRSASVPPRLQSESLAITSPDQTIQESNQVIQAKELDQVAEPASQKESGPLQMLATDRLALQQLSQKLINVDKSKKLEALKNAVDEVLTAEGGMRRGKNPVEKIQSFVAKNFDNLEKQHKKAFKKLKVSVDELRRNAAAEIDQFKPRDPRG